MLQNIQTGGGFESSNWRTGGGRVNSKPGKTPLNRFRLHLDLAQTEEYQTWVCVLFCLISTITPKSLNATCNRKLFL